MAKVKILREYDLRDLEDTVNKFLQNNEDIGKVISVSFATVMTSTSRFICSCMIAYEEKVEEPGELYWKEHPSPRMLRNEQYKAEQAKLDVENRQNSL